MATKEFPNNSQSQLFTFRPFFWPVHRNFGEKKLNFVLLFILGLKRTATIHSLSFSPCGHFLACSSNTETIHIFRLDDKLPKDRKDSENQTTGGAQSQTSGKKFMEF